MQNSVDSRLDLCYTVKETTESGYVNTMLQSPMNLQTLASSMRKNEPFDESLYVKYGVKRGLRNQDGTGVVAGITRISNVHGYVVNEYERVPCDGELRYRGINVEDIVNGCVEEDRFGFEETVWLLLFGHLPTKGEVESFNAVMEEYRELPHDFIEDMIMKAASPNLMNKMARSVLALYSYDDNTDDTSMLNVLRQSLSILAKLPSIMVAGYQAKRRVYDNESYFIHSPYHGVSTAENILSMMRIDRKYTREEALLLDKCLILHAEHGGGNNSTFAVRLLSSSGTDTYSAIAAGIGALKGPRHGGANISVVKMLDCMKENIRDVRDDEEISAFLQKLLHKQAGDRSGLIYGMGHAVYTKSDPRAKILKANAEKMAVEKGFGDDFRLLDAVERLAPKVMSEKRSADTICANVDLYSGLIYRMLSIPQEMFTPLFAVSRTAGWCAHRMEELETCRKIIRPAYRANMDQIPYVPLQKRKEEATVCERKG